MVRTPEGPNEQPDNVWRIRGFGDEAGADPDALPHDPNPLAGRILGPLPGTAEYQQLMDLNARQLNDAAADDGDDETAPTIGAPDDTIEPFAVFPPGGDETEDVRMQDLINRGRQSRRQRKMRRDPPWRREPSIGSPERPPYYIPSESNLSRRVQWGLGLTAAGFALASTVFIATRFTTGEAPGPDTRPPAAAPIIGTAPSHRTSPLKARQHEQITPTAHHYTVGDYAHLAQLLSDNGFQIVHSLDGGPPEDDWTAYTNEINTDSSKATWLLIHGVREDGGIWQYRVYIWNDQAPDSDQPGASTPIGKADATAPQIHRILVRERRGA